MTQTGTAANTFGIYMAKGSTVHLVTEGQAQTLCGKGHQMNPRHIDSHNAAQDAQRPESGRRLTEASKVTCRKCGEA